MANVEEKVIFSWSGGKDSALAFYELNKKKKYKIVALLTTLADGYDRITMHGIREHLLNLQAKSLNLALEKVFVPKNCSNNEYGAKMREVLEKYKSRGVNAVVFGDIFLEDLKKYREDNLSKLNMRAIFPLWKKKTDELAHKFIDLGFKTIITCVDSNFLDKKFIGRPFDKQFLSDLPPAVDPCGENGEFHSFVYDGPIFQNNIPYEKGEIVLRENRFYYCDLIPN